MDRRCFINLAALSSLTVLAPRSGWCQQKRPNIVFIMADDLGYGDLGCYGSTKIHTPHLDQMAREGLRFTQFYAGSTVCAPSRCSLMTGLHTGHTYIRGNTEVQPEGQAPLPSDTVTLAKILKNKGYTTGIIGKWGLGGPGSEGEPNRQGFDHWFGYLCQRQAHTFYPDHLWRNGERVELDGKTYSHDLMTDEALQFIEKNQEHPFFLYLPYTIPHAALQVPEDSIQPYRGTLGEEKAFPPGQHYAPQAEPKAAFAGMVSRLDRDIGRLRSLLQSLGLAENTLIFFTSDNGPHKEGGHNPEEMDSNGPLRGLKRDLYEGGIRVPMLACWPGTVAPGTTSDHVGAFWDILPTCAELAGAPVPDGLDGLSIAAELQGQSANQPQHAFLYWEFHEGGFKQAVRMGQWKAVRLAPNRPLELYDLEEDLTETTNVANSYPDLVQALTALMETARTDSALFPVKKK
ncbi:MAG: arylsulfatase [bacterium]|nr:arylsulfatase [bacterium]